MEWTEIDYDGTKIWATDFLDGVLLRSQKPLDNSVVTGSVPWPGWYVQEQRGDMNGPALRPRKERQKVFGIEIVEAK